MGRKVVTGYSKKTDGLLVVTDSDLSTLAERLGFVYKQVDGEHYFVNADRLENGEISEAQLIQISYDEVPMGFFQMFVADFDLEVNLDNAVCW